MIEVTLVAFLFFITFMIGVGIGMFVKFPTKDKKSILSPVKKDSDLEQIAKQKEKELIKLREKEIEYEEGLANIMNYDGTSQRKDED